VRESEKAIQIEWNFQIEDYILDPADVETRLCFGYQSKKCSEII
jgi:hypothetical protein